MKEDWFPDESLPDQLSTMPHLSVVEAMRLSRECLCILYESFQAAERDSRFRLADIAWRMREDNFQIVGDTVCRTNDVLPRGIHRAPGERRGDWSVA